jgi:hypothetical protein
MKKKVKSRKKEDMPEFSFKEFTPEESKIYEDAVNSFRQALAAGKTLRQAYDSYEIPDKGLEKIIQADFLKIIIAERHFGQSQTLDEIAKNLDITQDLLKNTLARMLQEVGITAANQFGQEFSGVVPKTSD